MASEQAGATRCAACGHNVFIDGCLRSMGNVCFRPDTARFWTLGLGVVPIAARACAACGFIQLYADTSKLACVTPDPTKDQ